MFRSRQVLWFAAILLAVSIVYSNSFHNSFHFDDSHTILDNPAIRSLKNLPRFFTDTTTFSILPDHQTYRPMVSASLAIDYALGHGYKPFWFHLSTFLVFLLQLGAMAALFLAILNVARPGAEAVQGNRYAALFATAWYGLHPAMAETVNYIIQRGDIYCTVGVVAALALYVRAPKLRKTGLYLLPFVFAMLSKPPAVVFPALLFLYIAMFERQEQGGWVRAVAASLPSASVCALLLWLQAAMTPKSFTPAIISTYSYCITQPFVLMRYFGSLFLPIHLNVDTDLRPFPTLSGLALVGFVFVALLLAVAWLTARSRVLRPISYGLLWFLIASLPTSLYRLSETENDHRMYMPFVGLVLAVVWAAFLGLERAAAGRQRVLILRSSTTVALLLLALYGYGAHLRNRVWRTDESLWLDDVEKCPQNGRGLMNYGLTQMAKANYSVALAYFQRALAYTPNYQTLEINLGVVYGALHQPVEAEQHFLRAIALAPADGEPHYYYGLWLYQSGRIVDAVRQLKLAVQLSPGRLLARDVLAQAYQAEGDLNDAQATATAALQLDPSDATARSILQHPAAQTAEYWISASLYQYQDGNYIQCIADAQKALKLRPNYELAYNNMGAAYAALHQWDRAIANEQQALRINPNFVVARNNLALYTREKKGEGYAMPANPTAEDWLNASLRDYQAGQYEKSIQDARMALRLRSNYAEAYNNIAAACTELHRWNDAIAAAQTAVRLKPDFQLAKNNLAWAEAEKAKAGQARHP